MLRLHSCGAVAAAGEKRMNYPRPPTEALALSYLFILYLSIMLFVYPPSDLFCICVCAPISLCGAKLYHFIPSL